MNKYITQIFVVLIILTNSCHKQEFIESQPTNVRMYGFGVGENHKVIRNGDLLQILQPTEKGKWDIRSIQVESMEQANVSSIDIYNILGSLGIENITLIGTSEILAYKSGYYALAVLFKTANVLQLRVITLNSLFQPFSISDATQASYQTNSIYSAPAICSRGNYLCITYGIKSNSVFKMKAFQYSIDNLTYTSLGTASIPLFSAALNEGAKTQLIANANEFIAYCQTEPEQYITLEQNNGEIVSMLSHPISDFGITHHHSLHNYNNQLFASCEGNNFAGLVSLQGSNSLGITNSYNPKLEYSEITDDRLTLSIRSIPPDLSTPDFSSLQFYDFNASMHISIQPEDIPVITPRYIYAEAESDKTYILLGLTPDNQTFLIKIDGNGKIISF